jgi:hypothetical protein
MGRCLVPISKRCGIQSRIHEHIIYRLTFVKGLYADLSFLNLDHRVGARAW